MASHRKASNPLRRWIIFGLILFVIGITVPGWLVEWTWLDSLGYPAVFWKIKGTRLLLFLAAFIVALAYLLPNFKILSRNLSPFHMDFSNSPLAEFGQVYVTPKRLLNISRIIAGVFAFFFASSFYRLWDEWFRFIHPQTFGETDPVFGLDVGFYIFRLPLIQQMQGSLIILSFLICVLIFMAYSAKGLVSFKKTNLHTEEALKAHKHFSVNLGIWLLLLSFGYFLDQFNVLFDPSGAVFGAGYTDLKLKLPAIRLITLLVFLLALYVFYQSRKGDFGKLFKVGGIVLGIGIVGLFIIPWSVQSVSVKPNELKMEEPYITNNIQMTRKAYGLDAFHETSYNASDTISYSAVQKNMQTINSIRLWDSRPILETYRQLQEIRLYYSFPSVSVNRYRTSRGYEQMMVSARELNTSKLPEKAQTWVNRHLQYTHGYGITMSPVARTNADGNPQLLIKDLPPVSSIDLEVEQPAIYYGQYSTEFKLVNTEIKELDYPEGKDNVYTHYDGRGGVPIDNFFQKTLFEFKNLYKKYKQKQFLLYFAQRKVFAQFFQRL